MKAKSGFSLIEVLIFTSILTLVFITISAIITVSLRNLKTQEYKILATHYGEELFNWLSAQKELDWNNFASKNGTFCFNNSPIDNWVPNGSCTNYSLNSIFKREVTINGDINQKNITIIVKWLGANGENNVTINAIFNPWEE
jgi:Tfp pilus assembly protein PilV